MIYFQIQIIIQIQSFTYNNIYWYDTVQSMFQQFHSLASFVCVHSHFELENKFVGHAITTHQASSVNLINMSAHS